MIVYFFRHGIAEDAPPGGDDASRELTPEGVEKTTLAARGLANLIEKPDAILTSPKSRAVQTAQIISGAFDMKVRTLPVLADGLDTAVVRAIARLRHESVLLVGHEPTLSRVVELLCAGHDAPPFVQMKKAGCACVEIVKGSAGNTDARLLWLATPTMLRKLAR
ncbi:MAG: phosphohistidine phosphatase SixA [Planctomycetes bacterium]|nr:phosphohistidine phosphatase SixA [Planctomycetota bacterium]